MIPHTTILSAATPPPTQLDLGYECLHCPPNALLGCRARTLGVLEDLPHSINTSTRVRGMVLDLVEHVVH
jgi:hypothetical protein